METYQHIKEILADLLDLDEHEITPESYLVRDLGAESIDFLELAVALNARFDIAVSDDTVFLRNLRLYIAQADDASCSALEYLKKCYIFLPEDRLQEILNDLEGGPVLKVMDLVSYVLWQSCSEKAA